MTFGQEAVVPKPSHDHLSVDLAEAICDQKKRNFQTILTNPYTMVNGPVVD